ncbi:MAG: DUF2288 family protein [Polyangiaceae bacterium]
MKGPVLFSDLAAHLARDAVFLVDDAVSLEKCAEAIAVDDVPAVKAWLDAGQLRKPTAEEREAWSQEPTRAWNAMIVQPYVLIQAIPKASSEMPS